jgi:hypothetical protein
MQHIPKPLLYTTAGLGLIAVALLAFLAGHYLLPSEPQVNTNTTSVANTTPVEYIDANVDAVEINDNANINTNETDEDTTDITDSDARMIAGANGVTWLAEPEELTDLGLMANSYGSDHYYKVGSMADGGSIIYAFREEMGVVISRFKENSDGSYVLLANYSDDYVVSDAANFLTEGVTVDTETILEDLSTPDAVVVNGLDLSPYHYGLSNYTLDVNLSEDVQAVLEVAGETDYGTMYRLPADVTTLYDNGSVGAKRYLLKLPDHSLVSYADTFDFWLDDGSVNATWEKTYADFADRQYMMGMVAGGCGVLGGTQYAVDMTPEALETVGSTDSGDTLYTVLDADSSLLRNAYESYKLGRDYEGSTVELLSYEDFVAETPVLIWQDGAGDYMLFLDNSYSPAVECGKPVVYLYPTQTTDVTVQVGASVRISEPDYGNGWSVTAQPDGQLTLADGSVYSNLYWEGKGYGVYPEITFGRVVSRNQVGAALRSDLIKQGLNAQEIKDFLDFWMPKMPITPYVRLSWLNTQQMNTLAPLNVQPRPDTVIRVFLDFAGQPTPDTNLQPQVLTAPARTGFTVTEWGGLLLGQ